MRTITVDETCADLPQLLLEVEAGGEVIISRDEKPIARLVPIVIAPPRNRPKVGELLNQPFSIPDEAFAPLTTDELQEWGL